MNENIGNYFDHVRMRTSLIEQRTDDVLNEFAQSYNPTQRSTTLLPLGKPQQTASSTPPADINLLQRITFGLAENDVEEYANYATGKMSAFEGYVESQLRPENISDNACHAVIAAAELTTLEKSAETLWRENLTSTDIKEILRPMSELLTVKVIRATHSKKQLNERLVEFWFDHFNIYAGKFPAYSLLIAYDRDVIRPHVLGNFRQMLGKVAHHPCMLFYLDNVANYGHLPNENFARELLELHTLGVAAFNQPNGYAQADVLEVARCLTGWTVLVEEDDSTNKVGEFLFRAVNHASGTKQVLGHTIAQSGEQEGERVLDILAAHPATARHIATKLCRYFIGDAPPENIINQAAEMFLAMQSEPDQLVHVVRLILLSNEFRGGIKFKRPFEAVVGALRATNSSYVPRLYEDGTSYFFFLLLRIAGHEPFQWAPPDGYPDVAGAWQTTSSLVMRWKLVSWLSTSLQSDGQPLMDIDGQHPANVTTATQITDYWVQRIYGNVLPSTTRQRLIAFMAQTEHPDTPLPIENDVSTRQRLHAFVGLLFMLPEFQRK